MSTARVLAAALLACLLTTVGMPGAQADDPLGDIAPAVLDHAERVLESAPVGRPLEVVVTTRASPGDRPEFTTVRVDGRVDAIETIADALHAPDTAGVEMVQPARMAAKVDDPLRRKQWGLDVLGYETNALKYSRGKGVRIAVIDTGVHYNHADLAGRSTSGRDFVAPGTSATDENGHGTAVAGIIAATSGNRRFMTGLAPQSTIIPVRVLDASGRGSSDDVAAGIVWAADQRVNVINMSLTVQDTLAIRAAVAYAQSRNIVVVAAAGNSGCPVGRPATTAYPASYPGVVGVGAITQTKAVADYSACGAWVDVVAPGSSIVSLSPRYPRLSGCVAKKYSCTVTGTSMAAPFVAAAAALRISRTGLDRYDADTISAQILAAARDLGEKGRDDRSGQGLIDLKKLLAVK